MNTFYKNIHQDIIDRCRDGDEKAQLSLYKLYYKAMYNVSLRIVNNSADAEDIMQEAFLSAFGKIGTYRGEVSFGSWLKKIVVNRSLDYLKKRKISFDIIDEKSVEVADNETENREININAITEAINKLPDGYRVVLSLYLIEGYDHDEISNILGISNSSSRTQLLRAKNRLRTILKDKELYSYK